MYEVFAHHDGLALQHHICVFSILWNLSLRMIGISCDEVEAQGLLLSHHRQVGDLFCSVYNLILLHLLPQPYNPIYSRKHPFFQ